MWESLPFPVRKVLEVRGFSIVTFRLVVDTKSI